MRRYRPVRLEQFHRRLEAGRNITAALQQNAKDLATLDKMIETAPEGSVLKRRLLVQREQLAAGKNTNQENRKTGNGSQNAETAFAPREPHDGSSGTTQSRPHPARAVKREVSAGAITTDPRGPGYQSAAAQPAPSFSCVPTFLIHPVLAQIVELNGLPGQPTQHAFSRTSGFTVATAQTNPQSSAPTSPPPPMPLLFYFIFVVALIAAGVALDRIIFRPGQIYYLRRQRDNAIALLNGTSSNHTARTWWQRHTAPAKQWSEEVWD